MGMEVNQLADAIKKQEVLRSIRGSKKFRPVAASTEGRVQDIKIIVELGGEELLLAQYEQQSAADKFADTMANLQSAC